MSLRLFSLSALLLLPAACTGSGFYNWTVGTQFALTAVELDHSLLHQRGSLPVFPTPTELDFGRVPHAYGSLGVSKDRRVVCRIAFREFGPDRSFGYPVVEFSGFYADDPSRIEMTPAPAGESRLGMTTVLHVRELSDGTLRVQGATGDRLLPYTYHFAPPPARQQPVPLPTVDR